MHGRRVLPGNGELRIAAAHGSCNTIEFQIPLSPGQNHGTLAFAKATGRVQPLASSGKHLLAHLSITSRARADHWRRLSPSFPWRAKTSAMVSHISSCRPFSGHRWSNSLNKTSSPPSIWYSSGLSCSTISNARRCRSVQMKEPRDDFSSLSMVRILLMAQTFHLLYSL